MDERRVQLRVGVMVLSAILVTGILVALFGGLPKITGGTYTVRVWVPTAPAVTQNTPVQKSGIRVGRVERIELAEKLPEYYKEVVAVTPHLTEYEYSKGVIITAEIDKDTTLYRDEICTVSTSLLGDPVLQIERRPSEGTKAQPEEPPEKEGTPPDAGQQGSANRQVSALEIAYAPEPEKQSNPAPGRRAEPIADGGWIEGQYDGGPTQVIDNLYSQVTQAGETLTKAGNQVEATFASINSILDEPTRKNIRLAASDMQKSLRAMQRIFGDEKTQDELAKAMKQLPGTLDNMNSALARVEQSLTKFVEPRDDGKPAPVDRMIHTIDTVDATLQKFTTPSRPGGLTPVDELVATIGHLRSTMAEIDMFAQQLNRRDSALGQLVNDPEGAARVRQVLQNVNDLTRQLKPIVNDLRVFSDTIARHPERLGVRGALQRYPGIK